MFNGWNNNLFGFENSLFANICLYVKESTLLMSVGDKLYSEGRVLSNISGKQKETYWFHNLSFFMGMCDVRMKTWETFAKNATAEKGKDVFLEINFF